MTRESPQSVVTAAMDGSCHAWDLRDVKAPTATFGTGLLLQGGFNGTEVWSDLLALSTRSVSAAQHGSARTSVRRGRRRRVRCQALFTWVSSLPSTPALNPDSSTVSVYDLRNSSRAVTSFSVDGHIRSLAILSDLVGLGGGGDQLPPRSSSLTPLPAHRALSLQHSAPAASPVTPLTTEGMSSPSVFVIRSFSFPPLPPPPPPHLLHHKKAPV